MASRSKQSPDVFQPAQFGQTGLAVAILSLAQERDRRTRRAGPTSPPESKDVDLVPGPVLGQAMTV
jgi:hypothetical protein